MKSAVLSIPCQTFEVWLGIDLCSIKKILPVKGMAKDMAPRLCALAPLTETANTQDHAALIPHFLIISVSKQLQEDL